MNTILGGKVCQHRNHYTIGAMAIALETGKLIVAYTVITIEPHHRSLFLCQRRNQFSIEVMDIALGMGKLIVAHTVITIEPHHRHFLLVQKGTPYNIGQQLSWNKVQICSGSHHRRCEPSVCL